MSDSVYFLNGQIAWKPVNYPRIEDPSGVLSVIELNKEIDFPVKRVFFLSNIRTNEERGFHAHNSLKQLIVCVSGSYTIKLDCGHEKQSIIMTSSSPALFLEGQVWREMSEFSDNAVMMVLCDREYQYDTVVRDYSLFLSNLPEASN